MTDQQLLADVPARLAKATGLDPDKNAHDIDVFAATLGPEIEAVLNRLRPNESSIIPTTFITGETSYNVTLRVKRDHQPFPAEGEPESPPSFRWD